MVTTRNKNKKREAHIFSNRIDKAPPRSNSIIDTGAPTSTGGMDEPAHICDVLGVAQKFNPPRQTYLHGYCTAMHLQRERELPRIATPRRSVPAVAVA